MHSKPSNALHLAHSLSLPWMTCINKTVLARLVVFLTSGPRLAIDFPHSKAKLRIPSHRLGPSTRKRKENYFYMRRKAKTSEKNVLKRTFSGFIVQRRRRSVAWLWQPVDVITTWPSTSCHWRRKKVTDRRSRVAIVCVRALRHEWLTVLESEKKRSAKRRKKKKKYRRL